MIIPKVLESRTEYAGKIVSIRRDKLTRGDGNHSSAKQPSQVMLWGLWQWMTGDVSC